MFNRLCAGQMGTQLHDGRRYIIQICRFDPSKGIDDVLAVYRALRADETLPDPPQLVVCGHGSVDDPDGSVVYNQVMQTIEQPAFDAIRADICVARLPPLDVLLNTLLRRAVVALQLSRREGKSCIIDRLKNMRLMLDADA